MEIPMTVKPLIPSHSGKAKYVIVWGGGTVFEAGYFTLFGSRGGGGGGGAF